MENKKNSKPVMAKKSTSKTSSQKNKDVKPETKSKAVKPTPKNKPVKNLTKAKVTKTEKKQTSKVKKAFTIILGVLFGVIVLGAGIAGHVLYVNNITYKVAFVSTTGLTFEGYESLEVKNGNSFTFTIKIDDSMEAYDDIFLVTANNKTLEKTNGVYIIGNVRSNLTINAFGVGSKHLNIQNGVLLGASQNQTNLIIPYGVKEINNNAFANKTTIVSVVIPDSVIKIGNSAFNGCSKLEEINLGSNVESFGTSVFTSTKWYFNQPDGLVYLNNWVYEFRNASSSATLTVKEGIVGVAPLAFAPLTRLQEAILPSTLKYIEDNVFSGTSLNKINFPENLKRIGKNAFSGNKLENLVFPSGLQEIGEYAFIQNNSLKEIEFNSNIKLEKGVFGLCSKLEKVTFNQGVQELNEYVFGENTSLKTIIIKGNTIPVLSSSIAFLDLPTNFKIYVPNDLINTYLSSPGWSTFGNNIVSMDLLNNEI